MNKYDEELARHEAAHFVMGWAVECPAYQVAIDSPQQNSEDHNVVKLGAASGQCQDYSPFAEVMVDLAGPVADHWEHDNTQMVKAEKSTIRNALPSILDGKLVRSDYYNTDWNNALRYLSHFCDIQDNAKRTSTLLLFLDAVRSTLKLCEAEWSEATEYLIQHGRIGYDGEHPDQGQGAEYFFCRWGDDWGKPPEAVQKFMAEFASSLKS